MRPLQLGQLQKDTEEQMQKWYNELLGRLEERVRQVGYDARKGVGGQAAAEARHLVEYELQNRLGEIMQQEIGRHVNEYFQYRFQAAYDSVVTQLDNRLTNLECRVTREYANVKSDTKIASKSISQWDARWQAI